MVTLSNESATEKKKKKEFGESVDLSLRLMLELEVDTALEQRGGLSCDSCLSGPAKN